MRYEKTNQIFYDFPEPSQHFLYYANKNKTKNKNSHPDCISVFILN